MIIGAHSVIYSTNSDADRAFLRDVIKLPNVDAGGGYVIFGLPPSEVAVHQNDKDDAHEFYLMCADVEALIRELQSHNVTCSPVQDEGWGLLTRVTLPGGHECKSIQEGRKGEGKRTDEKEPKGEEGGKALIPGGEIGTSIPSELICARFSHRLVYPPVLCAR